MFKRVGALATIPVVLGLVASLALAGTVLAAPWTSVNVTQTGPCDFLVWYSWGGQGHGSSLKAVVEIGAFDQDGNSSGAGYFDMTPTSGRDGNISHTFHVSTGSADPIKIKGHGFLVVVSKSQILAKSDTYSTGLVPASYVTCP